jgi:phage shock protein C
MGGDDAARQASAMTSAAQPLPPSTEPTPPSGAPARPQLLRSRTDSMAGGVCGGLAEYSGIDSLLWRVGFVGLTIAGGAGIAVYLLLWVLMPAAPLAPGQQPRPVDGLVDRLHEAATSGAARLRRD